MGGGEREGGGWEHTICGSLVTSGKASPCVTRQHHWFTTDSYVTRVTVKVNPEIYTLKVKVPTKLT